MMVKYTLPKIWRDYLTDEPETGMGYQTCDIHLPDKTLADIVVKNCSEFDSNENGLNLNSILDIDVKR